MKKISLAELAQSATAAQQTGETHGALAAEGATMDSMSLANIEKAAMAGDEQYRQAIDYLKEAREATFTDPFARQSYFKELIVRLNNQDHVDPENVLATFFSALGTKINVRGEKGKEVRPAIPLFRKFDERREAQKFLGKNVLPIRVVDSDRKEHGGSREHITGDHFRFLAPTTVAEIECYESLRQLLVRMPQVLADYFEVQDNFDVRQAVWLTLNLVPGARVFHPGAVKRIFEDKGDYLEHKSGGSFVKFELSSHECLVIDNTANNCRIVARLVVFEGTIGRVFKK